MIVREGLFHHWHDIIRIADTPGPASSECLKSSIETYTVHAMYVLCAEYQSLPSTKTMELYRDRDGYIDAYQSNCGAGTKFLHYIAITALDMSSQFARATRVVISPVAGLNTSLNRPVEPATGLPPIKCGSSVTIGHLLKRSARPLPPGRTRCFHLQQSCRPEYP